VIAFSIYTRLSLGALASLLLMGLLPICKK